MDVVLILLPFVIVPAVPLALIRPAGRRILGAIGLGFGLIAELLINHGPDNFAEIFPFLGFALAAAALLAETGVILFRLIRGKRPAVPRGDA
jgi:hypothetical protein